MNSPIVTAEVPPAATVPPVVRSNVPVIVTVFSDRPALFTSVTSPTAPTVENVEIVFPAESNVATAPPEAMLSCPA